MTYPEADRASEAERIAEFIERYPERWGHGPERLAADIRREFGAAHPEANRAPTQRERDRALSDYMAEHGPNAQRRRRDAARREADRVPEMTERELEDAAQWHGDDRAPEDER